MAIFGKSQEIAELQESLASATAERDQLSVQAAELRTTIETITAERDAALTQVATSQAAIESAEAAATARIAEIEAATQARIDAEVINRLASAGVDPIERNPEPAAEQTVTRQEFKKMSAHAKAAFCARGGKIQD